MSFKDFLTEASKSFVVVPGKGAGGTVMHLYKEAKEFKKFDLALKFMRDNKYSYYRVMVNEGNPLSDEDIQSGNVYLSVDVTPLVDLIRHSADEIVYSVGYGRPKPLDDEAIKKLKRGKRVS